MKARAPAAVTRQPKPLTVASKGTWLPCSGTGRRRSRLSVSFWGGGFPVITVSSTKKDGVGGRWEGGSPTVKKFLFVAQGLLRLRGERRVRGGTWAKGLQVDLKSASRLSGVPVRVRARPPLTSASGRFLQSHNCRRAHLVARLCQRDHAAPELLALAGVDVVLTH